MKLFCLTAAILFVAPVGAHDELFPSCPSQHPDHQVNKIDLIKAPISIYKSLPEYPSRELSRGKNGAVILEYIVTKEGKTSNIRTLSSTSTAFAVAAKKAVMKFKYEPAIDTSTGTATSYTLKHKVTFEIEKNDSGIFMESETLDFDPLRLSKAIKYLPSNPKKALTKIESLLESEANEYHRAVLYYVKSSKEYDINSQLTFDRKQSLLNSLEALSNLNQSELNVINLNAMAVAGLSNIYLFEGENTQAINLLRPFLQNAWNTNFVRPKVNYEATINLAIASYNSGDFCSAFYGFDRAIKEGESLKIKDPDLLKYRRYAKRYMKD